MTMHIAALISVKYNGSLVTVDPSTSTALCFDDNGAFTIKFYKDNGLWVLTEPEYVN